MQLIRLVVHHRVQTALVRVNASSLLLQLLIKITDTLISLLRGQLVIESAVSLSPHSWGGVDGWRSDASKHQVRWNYDGSATHTSMTVHQHSISFTLLNVVVNLLADRKNLLVTRDFEVLPIAVVVCDSSITDDLRVVREADRIAYKAITA